MSNKKIMDLIQIKDEVLKWGKKEYPKQIFLESSVALTLHWLSENKFFSTIELETQNKE